MAPRTIFRTGGKGRVKVAPEYISDLAALIGVQLQGCRDAIDRAESCKAPELRDQMRGQAKYYRAMESGLLGVVKRLGLGIDKAKLELARILMDDVLKLIHQSSREDETLTIPGVDDVPTNADPGGNSSPGEGHPVRDDGGGSRRGKPIVERTRRAARVPKE